MPHRKEKRAAKLMAEKAGTDLPAPTPPAPATAAASSTEVTSLASTRSITTTSTVTSTSPSTAVNSAAVQDGSSNTVTTLSTSANGSRKRQLTNVTNDESNATTPAAECIPSSSSSAAVDADKKKKKKTNEVTNCDAGGCNHLSCRRTLSQQSAQQKRCSTAAMQQVAPVAPVAPVAEVPAEANRRMPQQQQQQQQQPQRRRHPQTAPQSRRVELEPELVWRFLGDFQPQQLEGGLQLELQHQPLTSVSTFAILAKMAREKVVAPVYAKIVPSTVAVIVPSDAAPAQVAGASAEVAAAAVAAAAAAVPASIRAKPPPIWIDASAVPSITSVTLKDTPTTTTAAAAHHYQKLSPKAVVVEVPKVVVQQQQQQQQQQQPNLPNQQSPAPALANAAGNHHHHQPLANEMNAVVYFNHLTGRSTLYSLPQLQLSTSALPESAVRALQGSPYWNVAPAPAPAPEIISGLPRASPQVVPVFYGPSGVLIPLPAVNGGNQQQQQGNSVQNQLEIDCQRMADWIQDQARRYRNNSSN